LVELAVGLATTTSGFGHLADRFETLGVFDGQPPVSLRLIDTRRWDGSDSLLVRYEVGRKDA